MPVRLLAHLAAHAHRPCTIFGRTESVQLTLGSLLAIGSGSDPCFRHHQASHSVIQGARAQYSSPTRAATVAMSGAADGGSQPNRSINGMSESNGAATIPSTSALPSHHIPGKNSSWGPRFTNPWSAWQERGFLQVMTWMRERSKLKISQDGWLEGIPYPTAADFKRAFPLTPVDWAALAKPPADAVQALWVGHATVLTQMAGLTFITDPVMSKRCAPVQWAGPKRLVDPAFALDDPKLPQVDFVLLSHNHYDHLDEASVKQIHKRFGTSVTWYVPLGLGPWFAARGIKDNLQELDWWQEVPHKQSKATITMVPAMHWSARGVLDRRNTLWGGYVVRSSQPDLSFYFAGDTGYCEVFKEIGSRLGPFDLSAIPIGAYEPRWFMLPQHVNAPEALQIHRDVRSRRSLAIHCSTWHLTDEALDEPPRKLVEALQATGGDPQEFVTLRHGELLVVKDGQTLNKPALLGHAT